MTPSIWINGEVIAWAEARIGVEDRGFQFADGVYEVIRVYNGKPFTLDEHLARLRQSAAGIELSLPLAAPNLAEEIRRLIARSELKEGMVYLQLTRGMSERNHVFPVPTRPTLLFYTRPLPPPRMPGEGEGVTLLPVADERWKRCWIKSIALLANVLAKNQAVAGGFDEAVFVEAGLAMECSASNLFAVVNDRLVTHPVGSRVLPGITRALLLQSAAELRIEAEERPIREEEALRASELFITSTTREISWVARWHDRYIGQGRCGPVTLRLHQAYRQRVLAETR